MKPGASNAAHAATSSVPIQEHDLQRQERFEDELVLHLERDQFAVATARPVPRVVLSSRARSALLALRLFVLVVGAMVIYTFFASLH